MRKLKYTDTYLLEISIANIAKLNWMWPDLTGFIPKGNRLCAIEMLTSTEIALAPSGQVPIAQAILKNAVITVVNTNQEKKVQIPGYTAYPYANDGRRFIIEETFDTNWQGSSVSFATGTVPTVNTSIMLLLYSTSKY